MLLRIFGKSAIEIGTGGMRKIGRPRLKWVYMVQFRAELSKLIIEHTYLGTLDKLLVNEETAELLSGHKPTGELLTILENNINFELR